MIEIDRSSIERACAHVRPAVSKQDYVPAFQHYCFYEGEVIAYNDTLMLSSTLPDDAVKFPDCCVPAEVLSSALRTMHAEKIQVSHDEDARELVVKAGRAKLTCKTLGVKDFLMHLPDMVTPQPDLEFTATTDLIEGMRACLMAVGNNPNHPASMGITLTSGSGNAVLFATDNVTITRYQTDMELDKAKVIMPVPFCQAVLSFTKVMPNDRLRIRVFQGLIDATFIDKKDRDIGAIVRTTTLTDVATLDYEAIMRKHFNVSTVHEQFTPLPDDMGAVFDRAQSVAGDPARVTMRIVSGSDTDVSLSAQGDAAKFSDTLQFTGKKAPDALQALEEEDVDAALVSRALKHTDRLSFVKNALLFADTKGKLLHLVSYMAPVKKSKR